MESATDGNRKGSFQEASPRRHARKNFQPGAAAHGDRACRQNKKLAHKKIVSFRESLTRLCSQSNHLHQCSCSIQPNSHRRRSLLEARKPLPTNLTTVLHEQQGPTALPVKACKVSNAPTHRSSMLSLLHTGKPMSLSSGSRLLV